MQCPGPNDYYDDNGNLRSADGEILDVADGMISTPDGNVRAADPWEME
jgi:hypothetical protein